MGLSRLILYGAAGLLALTLAGKVNAEYINAPKFSGEPTAKNEGVCDNGWRIQARYYEAASYKGEKIPVTVFCRMFPNGSTYVREENPYLLITNGCIYWIDNIPPDDNWDKKEFRRKCTSPCKILGEMLD